MFDQDFLDEVNQLHVFSPDDPDEDNQITIYLGHCSRRWKDCKQYCDSSLP